MSSFMVALAVAGAIISGVALFAAAVKRYVSPALVSLLAGVVIGRFIRRLIPLPEHEFYFVMEEACRLTLAIGVMTAALRFQWSTVKRHWRGVAILLGGLMPLMWGLGMLITWLLFRPDMLTAMLVGAVLAPTDPVVAGSLVTGRLAEKAIPKKLRVLISLESGANDGLAYPFVLLPILLMQKAPGAATEHWLLHTVLLEVACGAALGAVVGYIAGHIETLAERLESKETSTVLTFSSGLSFLILGLAQVAGLDGILAVFVGGLAFNTTFPNERRQRAEAVQDAYDLLFTTPAFLLIGGTLPWAAWGGLGWQVWIFPVLILLFRRIPGVALLNQPLARCIGEYSRLMLAWAGPIGVSSVFYASLAAARSGRHVVWALGTVAMFGSVVVQGLATPAFVRLFGRVRSAEEDGGGEDEDDEGEDRGDDGESQDGH